MIRRLSLYAAVLALMVTVACNRPVNISSAPSVSYDIAAKLDQIQRTAEKLNRSTPQVLPNDQYARVLDVLKEANQYGNQFNTALKVYFAASGEGKATAEQQVYAALDALALVLPKVFVPINDSAARDNLTTIIGETQKFLLWLRSESLRGTPAPALSGVR